MGAFRIAVIDDDERAAQHATDWSGLDPDCTVDFLGRAPWEDLRAYDGLVAMRERRRFTADVLAGLPNLRLLVSTGMGTSHIDMVAAAERGLVVCGTESRPYGTVELTWALIFELFRGAGAEDRRVRTGRWGTFVGSELAGRTLGVAGAGRMGRCVAAVAQALGMTVTFWSPRTHADAAGGDDGRAGVVHTPREEFFSTADVLTVHLRLTPATRGSITAADLRLMQPSAYVVNTARAGVFAPHALADAVADGVIAGAAVDVFEREPIADDNPLLALPGVILSGHRGYVTRENFSLFYSQAVEGIRAYLDGAPVRVLGGPKG